MATQTLTRGTLDDSPARTGPAVATRTLLLGGVFAGPVYLGVGLLQAVTRPGFDVTRHDLSLLANGSLGWIQSANFLVTGLLVLGGALGIRRTLQRRLGGTALPLLLSLYSLGLIGAGLFRADPAFGFPPGTPATAHAISGHGLLHIVCGGLGFLALIAACLVTARRTAACGHRGWALCSAATGLVFCAAFAGIATGSDQRPIVLAFYGAVVLAWTWLSALSARLRTDPTFI
jgi:hypothetical protein